MTPDDHIRTVASCRRVSRQMFAEGENLLGSEMMWGAAIHSVNAVAAQRGWRYSKYSHKSAVVERLASEYNDRNLDRGFWAARHQLHPKFDKGFLNDADLQRARQSVEHFVERMLAIAGADGR